jgi:hypothetical protein
MASGAVDFWRLGSVARFQLLLAGVDLKADWHLVCTIRLALAVAFQLRPEKASPLRLEEGPDMKLGMMRGPQGMMFGLQGIAAIYPRSASRHRRMLSSGGMLSSGMPSTRDRDSALFRQQGAIRPSDTRLRSPRERDVRCFPSSAVRLVPSPRSKVASELQGYRSSSVRESRDVGAARLRH